MTFAVSHHFTSTNEGGALARLIGRLGHKRASRSARVRARRSELAMSEEARIHAQMQYQQAQCRNTAR